jgi:hypothetical protein
MPARIAAGQIGLLAGILKSASCENSGTGT